VSLSPDLGVGTKKHLDLHPKFNDEAMLQGLHVWNLVPEALIGSKEYGGEYIQVDPDFVFDEIFTTRPGVGTTAVLVFTEIPHHERGELVCPYGRSGEP
jgi:hypothetical protein